MTDKRALVKARLEEHGVSVADWSRENGFNVRTVYAVLHGELKAKRGVSHRIAVALGLKEKPRTAGI